MRKIFAGLAVFVALLGLAALSLVRRDVEPSPTDALRALYARKSTPSVDHALFPQLKGPFAKPQQVTAACISCHNGRAHRGDGLVALELGARSSTSRGRGSATSARGTS